MEIITNLFSNFWFESSFKLLLGFFLAGLIGLERSSWNKPAGFRTHALVGISAVLVMICGEYLSTKYNTDPSRIPAQLLSGIGFIGAGTILRDGFNVKGLTTASALLAVTCIGLSIGAGFYLGGIIATILTYIILSYSYLFSDKLDHFDITNLEISYRENKSGDTIDKILDILQKHSITIKHIAKSEEKDDKGKTLNLLTLACKYNTKANTKTKVISKISSLEGIESVSED